MKSERENELKLSDAIIGLLLVIPVTLLCAVVSKYGWDWFLVPIGIKSVGYVHMIGISALIQLVCGTSYIIHTMQSKKLDQRETTVTGEMVKIALRYLFLWLMMFIVHLLA